MYRAVFPLSHRLSRFRSQIFGQANTPLKRWLLDFATRRKESELRSGVVRKDSMWDKLIFSKVQVTAHRERKRDSAFPEFSNN